MKTRPLLLSLASALLIPSVGHGSLITGFEPDESFTVGDTGKTVGQWVLPSQAIITDSTSYQGDQSLKLTGSQITQYNPTLTQIGVNYNAAIFQFKADAFVANGQIGLWQVLYGGNQTESRVQLQLIFGATAEDPVRAEFLATFTGTGAPTTYTSVSLTSLDVMNWTEINFGFDFENQKFRITVGGQTVAGYEDLATGINQARIARLFLRGNAATVSYYDNVTLDHATVIPEPGVASLLLLPVVYWGLRRRVGPTSGMI